MNIFMREMRAHLKSLLIWSGAIVFLVFAGMIKYSAGNSTGSQTFEEIMRALPKSLQNLFGVGVFNLSVPVEYYAVLFIYISLVAAAHASMLGAGIVSKEERDKTSEFLLTKPVSRGFILSCKLCAVLAMTVIVNIVCTVSSFAALSQYESPAPYADKLIVLMVSMFALQILFAAVGVFFAAALSRPKLSAALTTGVMLFMFMLAAVIDIAGNIDFLGYFSFFKYYDAKNLLVYGNSVVYPVLTAVIACAAVIFSYVFYKKRDMKI